MILLSAATSLPVEKLPGSLLLDAFAVGFEVNARVAKAVGHKHYLHGWHTTATVCCFGAAAAAARVLRLSPAGARPTGSWPRSRPACSVTSGRSPSRCTAASPPAPA